MISHLCDRLIFLVHSTYNIVKCSINCGALSIQIEYKSKSNSWLLLNSILLFDNCKPILVFLLYRHDDFWSAFMDWNTIFDLRPKTRFHAHIMGSSLFVVVVVKACCLCEIADIKVRVYAGLRSFWWTDKLHKNHT